jgi:serine/threonine protein kinase
MHTQLADFGLAKVLSGGSATNRDCGGTLTHLAPEMFEPGSRITAAVDVYAFGECGGRRACSSFQHRRALRDSGPGLGWLGAGSRSVCAHSSGRERSKVCA